MGKKQPTANSFIRAQVSWAKHMANRVSEDIEEREKNLRARGVVPELYSEDDELMDLYDEEIFWERYEEEMVKQQEYFRGKYAE